MDIQEWILSVWSNYSATLPNQWITLERVWWTGYNIALYVSTLQTRNDFDRSMDKQ